MTPTRRTQPHRATAARAQTPALRAMQRGAGPLPFLQRARQDAMKRKRRRKSRARYSTPLARVLATRRRIQ